MLNLLDAGQAGGILAGEYGVLIVEAVAVLLLLIFLVKGIKQGFIKMFIGFFGNIICLILSIVLCSSVANFLQNAFGLVDSLANWVQGGVTNLLGDTLANTTLAEVNEQTVQQAGVLGFIINIVLKTFEGGEIPTDITLNQAISPVIGYYIACIISVIGLFIVFKILLAIIKKILTKLTDIALIGAIDKVLGAVLGLFEGVIFIQIAIMVLGFLPLGFATQICSVIDTAVVTKFIRDINLFELILTATTGGDISNLLGGAKS